MGTLTLIQCTREAEIQLPHTNTKMVVNSIFTPDSIMKIQLLESSSGDAIRNAEISIFENGSLWCKPLYIENGYYASPGFKPLPSEDYSIQIQAEGYPYLYAGSNIPAPIPIVAISHTDSSGYNSEYQYYYASVHLNFNDPPNGNNYYEVTLQSLIERQDMEVTDPLYDSLDSFYQFLMDDLRMYSSILFSFDPSVQSEGYDINVAHTGSGPYHLVFCDQYFDGLSKQIVINYLPYYAQTSSLRVKKRKVIVHLRSISYDYYRYRQSWLRYTQYENADVWHDPNDYIEVFSNIENGYGLFAGYHAYTDTVVIHYY